MHAFILPITVPTKTRRNNLCYTITINKIPNITMNLESNTTPKFNKQYLKSNYNNQQTLTNNNYTVTPLRYATHQHAYSV